MEQSYDPLNSFLCASLIASESTGLVCSSSTCKHRLVSVSHTRMVLSALALKRWPSVASTAHTISSWPSMTLCGTLEDTATPSSPSAVFTTAFSITLVSCEVFSAMPFTFAQS